MRDAEGGRLCGDPGHCADGLEEGPREGFLGKCDGAESCRGEVWRGTERSPLTEACGQRVQGLEGASWAGAGPWWSGKAWTLSGQHREGAQMGSESPWLPHVWLIGGAEPVSWSILMW